MIFFSWGECHQIFTLKLTRTGNTKVAQR